MKISQKGIDLITSQEGLILHPYKDKVGIPTIGYGTIRYPNGTRVSLSDAEISKEQAISFLLDFVSRNIEGQLNSLPVNWNQNQFDSICSFCYNEGTDGFLKSHLLLAIEDGKSESEIRAQFSKWVYAGGNILEDLVKRRRVEADLFFEPVT